MTYESEFFFYLLGLHLLLHSFPTRRSSDLCTTLRPEITACTFASDSCWMASWESPNSALLDCTTITSAPFRTVSKVRLDRKSTRLNSSHVAISYAVFCLKKKKIPSSVWLPRH